MGDTIVADMLSVCKTVSVDEFWSLADQQKNYIRMFYKEVCRSWHTNNSVIDLPFARAGMGEV